jgi:hypothetical protein
MLAAINEQGVVWYCYGGEYDEYCGVVNTAPLDGLSYRFGELKSRHWAMIDLPPCTACGAICSLKADYRLKELYKTLQTVTDEETGAAAYVMPLRFVRNLQAHWILYQSGRAEHAPVLEMPPQALLEHPQFASVKPSTVYALWFGYLAAREAGQALIGEGR